MRRRYWTVAVGALLTGCLPEADTPMAVTKTVENGRIQVTRIGVFEDSVAYDNRRGIYIIKDTATGKEYVGVSGIGISELGVHQSGKTTLKDER
jgi:hypothetical protein